MWAAAFGEKTVIDFLLEKVRYWFFFKKNYSPDRHVYILRTKWTHWCLWSFILRVQTPKQLQGSERAPWPWPALEATWTLLSLSSDTEWTSTLMTGYTVTVFMSYTDIQTDSRTNDGYHLYTVKYDFTVISVIFLSQNGGTPLLYAVRGNHIKCVQALLGTLCF